MRNQLVLLGQQTDTAFKIMMSDNRIAAALISEIFRDMKVVNRATPIQIL
ncbi:MAG: hypothetical protein LBJ13_03655 [Puniceicoccales bacterium]|nr:hypothetical protein [Puniceicoccales bacterium]